MKAGSEHRIPLSEPALTVLKKMMPFAEGKDALVFPSLRKKAKLSDMALSALVRGMNEVKDGDTIPWLAVASRMIAR